VDRTRDSNRDLFDGDRDLFGEPMVPEGFRYLDDVLTAADEARFVARFEALPLQPFEFQGYLANRRILTFGHKYVFAGQKPRADASIPDDMRPLLEIAAHISGEPLGSFEQVMVTDYPEGAGIGWHVDRPSYEHIVSISFLAPCVLRLRHKRGARWERRAAAIAPRSAYLLAGPARIAWQHSIAPQPSRRFSVTLRTFRAGKGAQSRPATDPDA